MQRSSGTAGHQRWQEDVVLDIQVLYEIIKLEDESDLTKADLTEFSLLHLSDALPADADVAGKVTVQTADQI